MVLLLTKRGTQIGLLVVKCLWDVLLAGVTGEQSCLVTCTWELLVYRGAWIHRVSGILGGCGVKRIGLAPAFKNGQER